MKNTVQDLAAVHLSRRDLLRWAGMSSAGVALAACAPATAPQTAAPADSAEMAASAEPTSVEIWTGFGQGRMAEAMAGAVERFATENEEFQPDHVIVPWVRFTTR